VSASFVLYVTGHNARSLAAATNLRRVCDERLGAGAYELEIVDVLDEPERADAARVIATPTAVRMFPLPRRRVIGDLSALDQLAVALELPPAQELQS
jgi:circadian clock protein KaiB